nr:helix-turn-helix domain-containing protein [Haloprofundus salinisoli]
MTIWDDRILEYIREEGSGSPKQLVDSGYIKVSRQHISRRLQKLAEHGMLTALGNGVYIITDKGEEYLDGEWDAEEDRPVEAVDNESENGNGDGFAESES